VVPAVVNASQRPGTRRDRLVVCVGNPARGDDGAGARVAALLESREDRSSHARVLAAHQLDVALAEDVAAASAVVFVDAERRSGGVEVRRVEPGGGATTHTITPAALLALAAAIYGAAPAAWLVSVPASEMGHGEILSPTTTAACEDAARVVERLLSENRV
jgi:hydrogenase maturation protease